MFVTIINQDLARDPKINAILKAEGQMNPVSTEHTPWRCERCSADCWIGPKQRLTVTLTGMEAVCYRCILKDPDFQGAGEIAMVSVNPDIDDVPRRFT